MKTCVVIPTYNEARAIGGLVVAVKALDMDVLVVDDGSTDTTAKIAGDFGARVLRNMRNEGKGASLIKGFQFVLSNDYDAVITMDGDGQHLPDDIQHFLRAAEHSSSTIFIGNRMNQPQNMPGVRFFTNTAMSWFISIIVGQKIPDSQCGFRLIKTAGLKRIKLSTNKYETESELLIKASRLGMRIESIPVKTIYRGEKSQIHPVRDTLRFIRFIVKESRGAA